ncbi:hypothetical protein MVEN_00082400 [Mycena venus]|uniref:Uncharacterized protein n=1 Tax=Mycena venus TaxID=2733690 RepID=A0A8H6Z7W4_9AGAR|nr:hypothetical protein MVEN_00082400 [Mycena venus]
MSNLLRLLCITLILTMHAFHDSTSILPLFSSPRAPPPVPSGAVSSNNSQHSSPPPEGFVVPPIPPVDCPFRVIVNECGHPCLPRVSDHPLPVDHDRVKKLIRSPLTVTPKCSNCTELAIECVFKEAGIPCPPCAILGVPDCEHADPHAFVAGLAHQRDVYLHHERSILCATVRDNHLAPSLFEREYERACAWFYAAARGAITRFCVNMHATGGVALCGYELLAASSTDAGLLSWFLALGHDACIHPSVLQTVADRLQALFLSFLS